MISTGGIAAVARTETGANPGNFRERASAHRQVASQKEYAWQKRRLALLAFAFSGTAALTYEVLWSRELTLIFGSTVYAVSMMLSSFMSGLALGAFIGGKWADKSKNLFGTFGYLELGVAIFGLLTIPLIQALPTIYFFVYDYLRPSFFLFFLIQMLLSFFIMIVPTTLMGATFPVVAKLNTSSLEELGIDVGSAYSVNTVGAILGSLGAGFLLIPILGIKATTFIAAGLNLVVSLTMLSIAKSDLSKKLLTVGGVALFAAILIGLFTGQAIYAHNFYRIADFQSYSDYQEFKKELKMLYFSNDIHGRIAVFEQPDGRRFLQNAGMVEGASSVYDKQTTSLFALLPIMSAKDPKSVLVAGLGTGYTSLAALSAPVDKVDIVEINKSVIPASRLFVGNMIEKDPRAKIYINDARNFIYTARKKYDVISSAPSYPLSTHVSHLFTKEYCELAKEHLNDGGTFCQWMPRYMLKDEDAMMMMKTFYSVFPQMYIWGSNLGDSEAVDVLLVGVKGNYKPDPAEVEKAIRQTGGKDFDFRLFGDSNTVRELVGDLPVPINTDDRPLLEFATPRNQIEFYQKGKGRFSSGAAS